MEYIAGKRYGNRGKQMTKKEMIEIIRNKETERWRVVEGYEKTFGEDSKQYTIALAKWQIINELLNQLGIEELNK